MKKVRKSYTEIEIKLLQGNPNVQRATEKNITYSPKFKVSAIQAYKEGQSPMEIIGHLDSLERQSSKTLSSSERFQIINQVLRKYKLKRVTRYLCQVVEVSTSGYYRWCNAESSRQLRDVADERDYLLIKTHF